MRVPEIIALPRSARPTHFVRGSYDEMPVLLMPEAQDGLGNEYTDRGGAFGTTEDGTRTDGTVTGRHALDARALTVRFTFLRGGEEYPYELSLPLQGLQVVTVAGRSGLVGGWPVAGRRVRTIVRPPPGVSSALRVPPTASAKPRATARPRPTPAPPGASP